MSRPVWLVMAAAAVLSACVKAGSVPVTIISAGEDHAGLLRGMFNTDEQVYDEARRICELYGRTPKLIDTSCKGIFCGKKIFHFACTNG